MTAKAGGGGIYKNRLPFQLQFQFEFRFLLPNSNRNGNGNSNRFPVETPLIGLQVWALDSPKTETRGF